MVTGVDREIRGQYTEIKLCLREHTIRSDLLESTTTTSSAVATFWVSVSMTEMGHYCKVVLGQMKKFFLSTKT